MSKEHQSLLRIGFAGVAVTIIVGCASNPPSQSLDTRTYCIRSLARKVTVCTPERVPSAAAEAEAKRFAPTPGKLTVYVVRGIYADAIRPVMFEVDGSIRVTTLPRSFARLQLEPGPHVLSLSWEGKMRYQRLDGSAGQVLFVELAGSAWPWERSYQWSTADPLGSQARALDSRFIGDFG